MAKRTVQRVALVVWFVIACALAMLGAYAHFSRPVSVQMGASLKTLEHAQLTYDGSSLENISPVCGCWKEQAAETWRGVSFAAQRLMVSRTGRAPLTAYVISAPWPARVFEGGPWIGLPSKSFGPVASFDPRRVLEEFKAQALPASATNIVTKVQYAIIVTEQPLQIHQFGAVPIAAWIPMARSVTKVRQVPALFPTSPNVVEIIESYQDVRVGSPREPRTLLTIGRDDQWQSSTEVPALDLLGQRTVLWTSGPSASVWLSEHFDNSSLRRGREGEVVGVVIDPAFSARIAVIPTTHDALARFAKVEKEELLPQPQDWLGVSDAGAVLLRLERTSDELREVDLVTARLKEDDTVEEAPIEWPQAVQLAANRQDVFYYEPRAMDFRYPPSPGRGLNVFGTMEHLTFSGATGSVVLGTRVVEIPAPSNLEFRNIENFSAATGVIPIAMQAGAQAASTTLSFSGVSEAWLNGEPLTRFSDRFRWTGAFFTMIAGLVQAVGAAVGLVTIRHAGGQNAIQ